MIAPDGLMKSWHSLAAIKAGQFLAVGGSSGGHGEGGVGHAGSGSSQRLRIGPARWRDLPVRETARDGLSPAE